MVNNDDLPTEIPFDSDDEWENTEATEIPGGDSFDDTEATEIPGTDLGGAQYTEIEGFEAESSPGWLAYLSGHHRGRVEHLSDRATTIAQDDGDIVLSDPKVSNPHAKIRYDEETFVIWDFGSTNGTYVNGEMIVCATQLEQGDMIKMGDTEFELHILGSKKKTPPKKAAKRSAPKGKKKSS
jgi:hypothetical protein